MNIVFMGTPVFAQIVFEVLCDKHNILAVVTQPDKPVGRKNIITPPPVKLAAVKNNITVMQPQVLDSAFGEAIKILCPDVIIVVAYGKILPRFVLDIAPCINLHASILPKYRGASPIQQMILSDDSDFGISIMQMSDGVDSGDILCIKKFARSNEDYPTLAQRLAKLGAQAICEVLEKFDTIQPYPQDEAQASYCKKITKADGLIDFDDAQYIYKKWLAFKEWPGLYLASGIKLFEISIAESNLITDTLDSAKSGEILNIKPCIIACKKGALLIGAMQSPSRKRMQADVFLRSRSLKIGDILQ